jgi:mono/diheme cytochrome c family protein
VSAGVENVLLANCGQCHGPLAPAASSGGITFINDLDRLIAAGLLVPLNSAASPIVIAMVNGSMPPPGSGLPPATDADIAIVTQYLDNPRFWPLPEPTVRDAGSSLPVNDAGSELDNRDAGGNQAP